MIVDHLQNAPLYFALGPRMEAAFRALRSGELLRSESGRHELVGPDVFAIVQHYETKPRRLGKWEAHRRYADIQFIVSGVETIGHSLVSDMRIVQEYDDEKDVVFLVGQGSFATLRAGMFAVFYPHDAHMPGLAADAPAPVHKIVVKVRVD